MIWNIYYLMGNKGVRMGAKISLWLGVAHLVVAVGIVGVSYVG